MRNAIEEAKTARNGRSASSQYDGMSNGGRSGNQSMNQSSNQMNPRREQMNMVGAYDPRNNQNNQNNVPRQTANFGAAGGERTGGQNTQSMSGPGR